MRSIYEVNNGFTMKNGQFNEPQPSSRYPYHSFKVDF